MSSESQTHCAQCSSPNKVLDRVGEAVCAVDTDWELTFVNDQAGELFGHPPEELLGQRIQDVFPGTEASIVDNRLRAAVETQTPERFESYDESRDSWVKVRMYPSDDGVTACFYDINDERGQRRTRERELERSRTFIEKAQESASIGGWEVDFESGQLRWTDEVYRIHGLPTDEDICLEDGLEFYHSTDKPRIQRAVDQLRAEGESYDLELRLSTAGGQTRWVRTVGDPVSNDDGDIVGARGIFQDITDRKEREQELRAVKERLDLAVEGAEIGIWDWNMETDEVTFNEQWAHMLGFSLDELEPHIETWEQLVHPADMAGVEEQREAYIAGETDLYDVEHRMESKTGEWKWIRDIGRVVERDENGEPTRAVGIHLDITEQKESTLHLEEERDMFAQGPAVVFKWQNEEGWPVEYVSENVTETFGYTPAELKSGEVPYTSLVHDDDIARVAREVDNAGDETTERFSHDPYRMVTKSGEIRWVTDNTKIIRHDGEITHYLGYLIDITEQKRLEQSLRESERSLRELTAIAADTDLPFEEKAARLLELGTERLDLPYGFLTQIDSETQHIVQAAGDHPQLQDGATAPIDQSYCRKTVEQDGILDIQDAPAEGWGSDPAYERFELGCYIGGTVVVNGQQYGTLCFADHASRDHEFGDAERAFVELLDQWMSYELESDSFTSKLQRINDTAQQLMSAPTRADIAKITTESANATLGMPMTGLWWYDEDADALVPERQTDRSTEVVGDQPTFERGDGLAWAAFEDGTAHSYDDLQTIPGRYNEATGLRSEVIVPLGDHGVIIASSTDPSAFADTDVNLLEVLSATVESALTRATRERSLRETRAKLEQSNEELEQFAYAASHDLQEPLRTVSSYLTLLERRYGDELDGDAVEFLEFAVDGADRMREMIQALLAYSRVDTRGQRFESIQAATIFEGVEKNLHTRLDETDATLSGPSTQVAVEGDASQLTQLFQNLVENSLTYNESTPRIDISVTPEDGMVIIEVTDNGIGMDPDQTDKIFDVFQRLHTREEYEGTGIGLAICRKIVDRHDGEIQVTSEPGEGSTVAVTLPRGGDSDE